MPGVLVNKHFEFKGHRDCIYTLAGTGDGRRFFSAGSDGMVVSWEVSHPDLGDLVAKLSATIYAIHYVKSHNCLVVGQNHDGIHILDWERKKELGSLKFTEAPIFELTSLDNRLFAGCGDGGLYEIDIEKRLITRQVKYTAKSLRAIAINTKAGELALGYSDNFIRIISLNDLSLICEWEAHEGSVFTLAYTSDFRFLISGSRDAHLKRWRASEDYSLDTDVAAHLFAINHLSFSPEGKHFVTCSMDNTIKVWRAEDMTLLKVIDRARHGGHHFSVNRLLWLDSGRLVSASDDRSISVWDIQFRHETVEK